MRVLRPSCRGRSETGRVAVGRVRPQNAAYMLLAVGYIAMVVRRLAGAVELQSHKQPFVGVLQRSMIRLIKVTVTRLTHCFEMNATHSASQNS